MDAMDFLRLSYCALSSRLGMVDRGFPATMKRLETQGFVRRVFDRTQSKYPGYVVTWTGQEAIRAQNRTFYSPPLSRSRPEEAS